MDREAAIREVRRRVNTVRLERDMHEPSYDPLYLAMMSEPLSALVEAFVRTLEQQPMLRLVEDKGDDNG